MTAAYRTDPQERSERIRLRRTAAQIGGELQFVFQEAVQAPLPEEWLELLRRADERMRARG